MTETEQVFEDAPAVSEERGESIKRVLCDVAVERVAQITSGKQDTNNSAAVWLAVLGEEVGEVSRALLEATFADGDVSAVRLELVQVAATACAWIEDLDSGVAEGVLE